MTSFMNVQLPSDDEEDEDFVPDEQDEEQEEGGSRKNDVKVDILTQLKKKKEEENTKKKVDEAWRKLQNSNKMSKSIFYEDPTNEKEMSDATVEPSKKKTNAKKLVDSLLLGIEVKAGRKKGAAKCPDDIMKQFGLQKKKAKFDKNIDAAAMAKEALDALGKAKGKDGMVTIEETRRFAGKNVTMQRDVEKGSAAALKATKKKDRLDALLESIAPAKKVTVLDKSKSDWSTYKSKAEDVQEELEAHKKSADTYLGKKEFLSRAELAEYERERDRKLSSDVRNRGRL